MQGVKWGRRALVLLAASAVQVTLQPVVIDSRVMAQTEKLYSFDIPPKSILRAVNDISNITGIDVVLTDTAAATANGNRVQGSMSVAQALETLLAGSGLQFRFTNAGTVTIVDGRNAGSASGATTLSTIVVKGARPVSEGSGRYTVDTMSTATGLSLGTRDTPQSVSVVTSQQIKDQGTTTVADALKKTTGINVIRDSGSYRFLSRGFYMDQVQEDGMNSFVPGAQINPYRSGPGLNDLDIYDRIEVVRGPSGLMQGTGEPGGTVNLVRKRPTADFQASSVTTVGSWEKLRETVDVSGSLNAERTVRARFIGVGQRADSFKNNVDEAHATLYGVVEADAGKGTRLTAGALHQSSDETPDYYGLPLTTGGVALDSDRSRYLGAAWNSLDTRKRNVFLEVSHELGENWTVEGKINHTRFDSVTTFAGLTRAAGVAVNGLASVNNMLRYDNDGGQSSAEAKLTGRYDLFGRRHDLFAAASYTRGDFDSRYRRLRNSTSYNVYSFTGGEIAEPNWDSNIYDDVRYDYSLSEAAVNLGTRFNILDDTSLIAGGRLTRFDYSGTTYYVTYLGSPDGEVDKSDLKRTKFIPYLGVTYDAVPGVTLYASYSNIFKPQSVVDARGSVLPPVEGENYEVGVKTTLLGDRINATFALFQIEQKNRAIYDTASAAYYAEGAVRSRGFEVELSGAVTDDLNLFLGYTFNRSKYLETESATYGAGTAFSPHTPLHMLRLHSTYRLPVQDGRWTIGGGVQMQSGTRSINNIAQGGYAVWDASLKYDVTDRTMLQLVVNNILDKRYFENNRTRTLGLNNFYGDPRNASLTLTHKF